MSAYEIRAVFTGAPFPSPDTVRAAFARVTGTQMLAAARASGAGAGCPALGSATAWDWGQWSPSDVSYEPAGDTLTARAIWAFNTSALDPCIALAVTSVSQAVWVALGDTRWRTTVHTPGSSSAQADATSVPATPADAAKGLPGASALTFDVSSATAPAQVDVVAPAPAGTTPSGALMVAGAIAAGGALLYLALRKR